MDKKEKRVSRFSVEKFLSHSAENFRRGILYCCINFVCRKSLDKRKGISRIYVEIFLSGSAERLRRGILFCFNDFGYLKGLDKRGGGEIQILRRNFFSHSAESFRRGILYCCINFVYQKSLDKRRGGYQDFPSKIFCLTVPKVFVEESFTVAVMAGTGNVWIRRGSFKIFRRKIFVSQWRKLT